MIPPRCFDKPLIQMDSCLPAKGLTDGGAIDGERTDEAVRCCAATDQPGAQSEKCRGAGKQFRGFSHGRGDSPDQIGSRNILAVTDKESAISSCRRINAGLNRVTEIADMDEAAPVIDGSQRERNAAVYRPEQLQKVALDARAVDQRWPQDCPFHAGGSRRLAQRFFGLAFADAVSVLGRWNIAFVERAGASCFTVDFDRAQHDEAPYSGNSRLLCETACSFDIDPPEIGEGIIREFRENMGPRGEMDDAVDASQCLTPVCSRADFPDDAGLWRFGLPGISQREP